MSITFKMFNIQQNAAAKMAAFCLFAAVSVSNMVLAQTSTATPTSAAAQFASIGEKPAIVFDAPSNKAQKTFILLRQQPVEVLVKLDKWAKIRDADNTIGWVETTALENKRRTQILTPVAEIYAAPNLASNIVFEAQRMVILDITGAAINGWLPVRHRDGTAGFVRKDQVWGE